MTTSFRVFWRHALSAIIALMAITTAFAVDEQWGSEFFSPVNPASTVGGAPPSPILAMTLLPDGRLVYGGGTLKTDDTGASVVVLSGNSRTGVGHIFGSIRALVADGSNLYAGGKFIRVENSFITNVAKWDGSIWNDLGGGVSGGSVRALAFKDGNLYVGGSFTNAGGVSVSGIAVWNGTNWSDLANGVGVRVGANIPEIRALKFIGDRLYVGGQFSRAGGIAATNIAEFSNGQWKSLSVGANNGVAGGLDPAAVNALATNSLGELIVGGTFRQAGDVPANFVAKWTGAAWQALGLGVDRPSAGSVDALFCLGDEIYASGWFIYANGALLPSQHRGLAKWDGQLWQIIEPMTHEGSAAMTGTATNIFIGAGIISPSLSSSVTSFGILRGEGETWSILGGGLESAPTTIVPNGTNILTTGPISPGNIVGLIEWDGNNWRTNSPNLGGNFDTQFGDVPIAKMTTTGEIRYAVGTFFGVVGGPTLNGIAAWDGTNWSAMGDGLPSAGFSVATRNNEVWVGHRSGVARWSGSAWENIGDLPGPVFALAFDDDKVYAAGSFSSNASEAITNIARWDGTAWRSLGAGIDGPVRALAVIDHNLYAGGTFSRAGDKQAFNLARWDNSSWSNVGGGVSFGRDATGVNSLVPDGAGGLFVGGDFQVAGKTPAGFVALWTGQQWETLGSGVDGPVNDMTIRGGDLMLVGRFSLAGGHRSAAIARWEFTTLALTVPDQVLNGLLSLEAHGSPGAKFVLQESSDLKSWQNVSSNQFTTSRLTIPQRSVSAGDSAFYRIQKTD